MKHIHFIGICGVAMGSLALAFKRAGWIVTGSDAGFYPPMSTYLKNAGVEYYPGWHPEKIGTPDLVVVGNVASSQNPEWLYVQDKKIEYKSYPEAVAEFFVKNNSVVCAGTYGKTSCSTLLSWILKQNKFDPSYMFGGLSINENFPSAVISSGMSEANEVERSPAKSIDPYNEGDSSTTLRFARNDNFGWSVLEGDEYKSARWDNNPKFSHYRPTHLLLTAIEWDHADVYPKEADYLAAFENLVKKIPTNGLIVSCVDNANVEKIILSANSKVIKYGKNPGNDYSYCNLNQTKNGIEFDISDKKTVYHITSPMLGEYQAENIAGTFAMAREIGIAPENIIKAITEFKGMKRRLQKRLDNGITIFDDIAHSPTKAKTVLYTLRKIYTGKIFAIFEPNSGNRQPESIPCYENAFINASEVIIPRLTKIKIDVNDPIKPFEGNDVKNIIAKTQPNVQYIEDDDTLIKYIADNAVDGDVVVFLGSHGFRGMIENTVKRLSKYI